MRRVLCSSFIVTLFTAGAAFAQDDALPDLTDIKAQLTELRGLEFKRAVPSARQSLEDWGDYLDQELNQMFPANERDDMMKALMRLGLLKKPMDLGAEMRGALLSQAAAYYDPESGTFFYLMDDMTPEMIETVAAHELVHALQDQHFGLNELMAAFESPPEGEPRNDDRLLALRFLVEGEATYVQTLWQMKTQMGMDLLGNKALENMTFRAMATMDLEQLAQTLKQQGGAAGAELARMDEAIAAMADIPPYIMEPLSAAYVQGAYYVMQLRHNGGWDGVAEAYRNAPLSSEQVLHAEKFLGQRDDPSSIDLAPLDRVVVGKGWTQVDAAIHGEFFIQVLLRNCNLSRVDARSAARGWDGDAYSAYRGPDGQIAIVFATTWDDAFEAEEFFDVYRVALRTKYPERTVVSESATSLVFSTPDAGDVRLLRRGLDVIAVEGFDAADPDIAWGLLACPVTRR